MPIGPNGEKRPADIIANAVRVMQIATGEAEEEYNDPGRRKGGKARADSLSAECRSEIAKAAARRAVGGSGEQPMNPSEGNRGTSMAQEGHHEH